MLLTNKMVPLSSFAPEWEKTTEALFRRVSYGLIPPSFNDVIPNRSEGS